MSVAFLVFALSVYLLFTFSISALELFPRDIGGLLFVRKASVIDKKVMGSTFIKSLSDSEGNKITIIRDHKNISNGIKEFLGVDYRLIGSLFKEFIIAYIDPQTLPGDIPRSLRPGHRRIYAADLGRRRLIKKIIMWKLPIQDKTKISGYDAGRIGDQWVVFIKNFMVIGSLRDIETVAEAASGPKSGTLAGMDEWQWAYDEADNTADISFLAVPSGLLNTFKYASDDYPIFKTVDDLIGLQAQKALALNGYINKNGLSIDVASAGGEAPIATKLLSTIKMGNNYRDILPDNYIWALFLGTLDAPENWNDIKKIYSDHPEVLSLLNGLENDLKDGINVDFTDFLSMVNGEAGVVFFDQGENARLGVIIVARLAPGSTEKFREMENRIWGRFESRRMADLELRYLKRLMAYAIKDDVLYMTRDVETLAGYMEAHLKSPASERLEDVTEGIPSPWSLLAAVNLEKYFKKKLPVTEGLEDGALTFWTDGKIVRAKFYTPTKIGDGPSIEFYTAVISIFYAVTRLALITILAVSLLFTFISASRVLKEFNAKKA